MGRGLIGSKNVSIDGRGGGATAKYDRATSLTMSGFNIPDIQLETWEELGQYRVVLEAAPDGPLGGGVLGLDYQSGEATMEVPVSLNFKICSYPFKECDTNELTKPQLVNLSLSSIHPLGRKLDAFGQARLAGTVQLGATGALLLDSHFGLPAAATFEIESQVLFPNGAPEAFELPAQCRGGKSPLEAASPLYFESLVSSLAIGAGLPPFRFDPALGNGGRQPGGAGIMSAVSADGLANFTLDKDDVAIAPLEVLPAIFNISLDIPVIAVNITVESDLIGTFNFCTGVLNMLFNASFTPVVGNLSQVPIAVATTLTTETSVGFHNTRQGKRVSGDGDCELVGVAKVPATTDWFVNYLLSLPNDAITEMPSIFTVGCSGVSEIKQMLQCPAAVTKLPPSPAPLSLAR